MPFKIDLQMFYLWWTLLFWSILRVIDAFSKFENAATKTARLTLFPLTASSEDSTEAIPRVQITVKSGLNLLQVRELTANTMSKLVRIPGIVISASVLSSRASKLHLQCRACRSSKMIYPQGGLGGLGSGSDRGLPRVCDAPVPEGQSKDCPLDPYLIIHSKSTFVDQQTLKLQEAPDMVPVGELPRHMLLSADRHLTGKVVPGSRIIASGIYSQFQSSKNVRCYLFIWLFDCINRTFRSRKGLLRFDNHISVWFTSSWWVPLGLAVRILSAHSLHLSKRKSLARWLGVTDSMSALQKVWLRAFLEALVCLQSLYNNLD